jgi:peptidoglycan/LPS O-acetylase OafA/YrhL
MKGRLPELDGLRGIAITMVLVLHYVSLQLEGGWLKTATSRLHYGVDLFFVLSGFLIASILLENRAAPHYFRAFYARRFARILPLYILTVAAYFIALRLPFSGQGYYDWLMRPELPWWTYATFTQNFWMAKFGKGAEWLSVTWSLAVEEQFYLTLPLLVRFLPARLLGLGVVATMAGLPVYRLATGHSPTSWLPFFNADCMAMGVLLALLFRGDSFGAWLVKLHRPLGVLALALVGLFACLSFRPEIMPALEKSAFIVLFGLALALPIAQRASVWAATLRLGLLIWLGQRSYGIYLIHQVVSSLLHGAFFQRPPRIDSIGSAAVTLLALGVALVVAELSFRYFESPFIRRAHAVKYRPSPAI